MGRFPILVILVLFAISSAPAQDRKLSLTRHSDSLTSEKRVALVIGNAGYADAPLTNPVNDARDVANTLAELGFEVIQKENLTLIEMKRTIRVFGQKLRSGGVSLFYYAGHGVQVDGQNYLIPVGASITNEYDVEDEALNLNLLMSQIQSAQNRINIVVLDACRNNPFARSFRSVTRGLASVNAPGGTFIAYSTAPGSIASDGSGKNGLYTEELLTAMRLPDLRIEDVFKRVRANVRARTRGNQIPWESSALDGDFYFSEKRDPNTGLNPDASIDVSGNWELSISIPGDDDELKGCD